MSLIDDVHQVCHELRNHGWRDLLRAHGLDITAQNLEDELRKPLPNIRRDLPGFGDFAVEGVRGIEPDKPARSLLYHALASPHVITGVNGAPLTKFPSLQQIDVIENYVFAAKRVSLQQIAAQAGNVRLAVVVFATEYRPSAQTVHQKHADLCFSRTGIARVGTADALYDGKVRGFLPIDDNDQFAIRVLPSRYVAYIAGLKQGDKASFVPMRFQDSRAQERQVGDGDRFFWVPFHKLFSGSECLTDVPKLSVAFQTQHVNEKLRRVHLALGSKATWKEPEIDHEPFTFTQGIAEFRTRTAAATTDDLPAGTLVPVVHPRLVEPASFPDGRPVTMHVPAKYKHWLSSSFSIPAENDDSRHGPEYVHVRRRVKADGTETDLNNDPSVPDVEAFVRAGNYDARHFLDFTGDGWIKALCPQLGVKLPRSVAAYSLVTAPDFFPGCDQRELTEWTAHRVPQAVMNAIWAIEPDTLCDQRFPANLNLKDAGFRPDDDTVTAIVSLLVAPNPASTPQMGTDVFRHSHLPDDAAGVFAPGWDVSFDRDPHSGVHHLAAYGLGSPFPEDSKLCAALSTFWAAVAPDATREFRPTLSSADLQWPTVSPLTDEEIGQAPGSVPWDGVPGPQLIPLNGKSFAEYIAFANADYVTTALNNRFTMAATAKVDEDEYETRVLAMLHVYQALGVNLQPPRRPGRDMDSVNLSIRREKARWTVFSFAKASAGDPDFIQAQNQTGVSLHGHIYKFKVFLHGEPQKHPNDRRKEITEVKEMVTLFADASSVLIQRGGPQWRNVPI